MKAIDKWGLIEFKQKARKFYLKSDDSDSEDIAEMKDAINYIMLWLCELEDINPKVREGKCSCEGIIGKEDR